MLTMHRVKVHILPVLVVPSHNACSHSLSAAPAILCSRQPLSLVTHSCLEQAEMENVSVTLGTSHLLECEYVQPKYYSQVVKARLEAQHISHRVTQHHS